MIFQENKKAGADFPNGEAQKKLNQKPDSPE
jgi:hypothetical protein